MWKQATMTVVKLPDSGLAERNSHPVDSASRQAATPRARRLVLRMLVLAAGVVAGLSLWGWSPAQACQPSGTGSIAICTAPDDSSQINGSSSDHENDPTLKFPSGK